MIALAVLFLVLANVAYAQVSTAALLDVEFGYSEANQSGIVIGTGAEGTSFIISGTLGAIDRPYTMTVVQDATHYSKGGGVGATDAAIPPYTIQCDLSNTSVAICTEQFALLTTTFTESVSITSVVVSPGTGTGFPTRSTSPVPPPSTVHASGGGPDNSPVPSSGGDLVPGLPPNSGPMRAKIPRSSLILAIPVLATLLMIL
ncbi:uncharacterized protein FOMMEDRAFT_151675 [Fomitiporia mediterranea MF3/22]|uniref:uncharacterized protein n=1 Tax=Fomitiporia mediterranea (strain MF3/22) TaxID=694068 RepID=UPI0004407FD5|nr:uncharacterized protein FOMMEDRAFT_151675 [Fomitiporia mediterranea MF3/22]EJD06414.1 hypothetical protein FOMMEDRAFT_151675 [Fomitiporia mediterranea MF3/22]